MAVGRTPVFVLSFSLQEKPRRRLSAPEADPLSHEKAVSGISLLNKGAKPSHALTTLLAGGKQARDL